MELVGREACSRGKGRQTCQMTGQIGTILPLDTSEGMMRRRGRAKEGLYDPFHGMFCSSIVTETLYGPVDGRWNSSTTSHKGSHFSTLNPDYVDYVFVVTLTRNGWESMY